MNLISISKAAKEIGDRLLYQEISFGVDDTDKIGLIGANGSGKSTFVNILVGCNSFDKGSFVKNKSLSIGYLPQNITALDEHSILDFILASSNERMKVYRDYNYLQNELIENIDNQLLNDKLEKLESAMASLDAYRLESDAKEILHHLGIKDLNLQMNTLSGGELKKIALARTLLEENNMLILDEPTNHLDITSIAWLESYLMKTKRAMILITHDRYFLDNVTDIIIEIDKKSLRKYKGNFSKYLIAKSEIESIEERTLHKKNRLLVKELEWLSRMPKARGTKQKARIDTIKNTQEDVASFEKNKAMGNLFSQNERLGKRVLEVKGISKSYAHENIFPPFSYEFKKGERIAIIGKNGAGKTTLLKMIMGEITSDTGKVIYGVNTKLAYLDQKVQVLDQNLTLIDSIREIANYIEDDRGKKITAKQLLERFLFSSSKHYQKIATLSGGERRRLDIIRILISNPNFLILDEPTNDLDLQTLAILEEYLLDFDGCLLLVSHDRYFLDKIADSIITIEKGQPIQSVNGICSDYIFSLNAKKVKNTSSAKPQKLKTKQSKLSYKYARRKVEIEKEMPTIEKCILELEKNLASGETNVSKIQKWSDDYNNAENRLLELLTELEQINTTI